MIDPLSRKTPLNLLWLCLVLAGLATSVPAGATLPSWFEVSCVNQGGLMATARQYLSRHDVDALEQSITREPSPGPSHMSHNDCKPPLVPLKNGAFINELVEMAKTCLARGENAKVKKFFQAVNQRKLIRGFGRFYMQRGGYGGPMVIKLDLLESPQKEFQVEVWYQLIHPGYANGQKREGPRRTYPTGITAPQ
ncbi:MAG: hypothetical protein HQK57_03740 [Deltaproteobacteria bacterium]|nr:hypothetical protein [Deltaproteobacteria bacterium]MBF0524753.1 hypothetical protein [Deltaproteobacteria bacterium]